MMKQLLACTLLAAAVSFGYAQTDVSGTYAGTLNVTLTEGGDPIPQADTIYLSKEEAGTYAISIKDFSFGEGKAALPIGDLEVPGITATEADGVVTLTKEGTVEGPTVELAPGVSLPTTITFGDTKVEGDSLKLNLSVDVSGTMTVYVSFAGEKENAAGIATMEAGKLTAFVLGNHMVVEGTANNYTIFNTAGAMVQHGLVTDNHIDIAGLKGGIYIAKIDSHIIKFIKK